VRYSEKLKRKNVDLSLATSEKRREIRTQEECIEAGEVNIPSATSVNTVDCLFKTIAELHFIDEEPVVRILSVHPNHSFMQSVILKEILVIKVEEIEIDVVRQEIIRGGL
jgi:hypothetical protein